MGEWVRMLLTQRLSKAFGEGPPIVDVKVVQTSDGAVTVLVTGPKAAVESVVIGKPEQSPKAMQGGGPLGRSSGDTIRNSRRQS